MRTGGITRTRAAGVGGCAALIVFLLAAAPTSASVVGYSPMAGHGSVAPLSPAAPKILFKIPLGKDASGGAIDTANGNVFVSNAGSNDVTVVNATTHSHSTVAVGKAPDYVVYDPSNGDVYVPNEMSGSVSIIDGASNKVTSTVKLGVGTHPYLASVDPANGNVLVFNNLSYANATNAWFIVNSTHAVKKLSLGLGVVSTVAYNPKSKDLYVPNPSLGVVQAITPSGTIKSITVPGSPQTVVYDPAGSTVLFVLLPNATRGTEFGFIGSNNAVGGSPPPPPVFGDWVDAPAAYDPTTHAVYFISLNYSSNTSYAVEINALAIFIGAVTLGKGVFFAMAFDPANSDLDVAGYSAPVVDVVNKNTTAVVKTLKTSQSILFPFVYDPTAKAVFGAGYVNATTKSILYEISSGNSLSSVTVGPASIAFAYDPVDTYVYVASVPSDSLDIVD